MFDKFGFCKWEASCNKVHLKETCLLEECDSRKCQKRHPRPCKFFTERGNCKYGGGCRFDHRPPKHIRSLVSRLDALENENKTLLKVIENQNMKIDKITEKCNTSTSEDNVKGLDLIKKQIAQLILANKKKTKVMKQIHQDLEGMNTFFKTHIDTIYENLEDLESKARLILRRIVKRLSLMSILRKVMLKKGFKSLWKYHSILWMKWKGMFRSAGKMEKMLKKSKSFIVIRSLQGDSYLAQHYTKNTKTALLKQMNSKMFLKMQRKREQSLIRMTVSRVLMNLEKS